MNVSQSVTTSLTLQDIHDIDHRRGSMSRSAYIRKQLKRSWMFEFLKCEIECAKKNYITRCERERDEVEEMNRQAETQYWDKVHAKLRTVK